MGRTWRLGVHGLGNLWFRGISPLAFVGGAAFHVGDWGRTLAEKVRVVAVILATSGVHDFWIGPRAARLARTEPTSRQRERFRWIASWAGRVNFLLALVVLGLAIQLVR